MKMALALLIGLLLEGTAYAANSEMHLRMEAVLVQKLLNEAVGYVQNSQQEIVRNLPNYNQSIPVSLSQLGFDQETLGYAAEIINLDQSGAGNMNILLESPVVKGNVYFDTPKFTPTENGQFTIDLKINIRNFNISFKHIWFTSNGLLPLEDLSANSCHKLIRSGTAVLNEDFYLNAKESRANLKKYLTNFYASLDAKTFKGHEDSLWARIDNLTLGWQPNQYFNDSRNIIVARLKLLVDPKKNGNGISVISLSHNIFKKGGAYFPIYMPQSNIILPPSFVRTQARKIVNNILTDEEIPRCTYVNNAPTKKIISSLTKEISKQISLQLTTSNINKMVATANVALSSLSIPKLPESLVVSNEDKRDLLNQMTIAGSTFYIYQDVNFDFNTDIIKLLKTFTTYRAGIGFEDLIVNEESNSLSMGFNSDLVIDGTQLKYRETLFDLLPILNEEFKWSYDLASDVSIALNGKLLNKIINPIKDHLLKTQVPQGINVYMNDNIFQVDKNGWIDLSPRIELDYEGYEILRLSFTVKAKPEIYHGQDGKSAIKIKLDVPSAANIINSIKPGTIIKVANTAIDIVLWPLSPIKEYIVKEVKESARQDLQTYIDNIKNNYKEIDITPMIKTYGISPSSLKFHKLRKDNFMELKLQIRKFYGLEGVMKGLI
jgi:hypothetical protein